MRTSTKQILLLAACQALMMSGTSLLITSSALVGQALAPRPVLATLPLGFQFIAMMLTTFPASLIMRRLGRRFGFLLGTVVAMAGAAVSFAGIVTRDFWLFCLGGVLLGCYSAVGQYYRFAAADVVDESHRGRAISLVFAGGIVAAFIGPNVASWSKDWIAGAMFAGGFAVLIGFYALSAVVLMFVRIPRQHGEDAPHTGRALSEIVRQPKFVTAALSGMIAYGVMNLVMTATPLAMQHHHHAISDTAFVIQWHVLAMFVPAFFTGHLISRVGVNNVMLAGCVLLLICVVVNLTGVAVGHFWFGLVLLGVGWNFVFVGATYLLTQCYRPEEKAKTQGINDLLVFGMVSCTALGSGVVQNLFGWQWVNYGVLPFVCVALSVNLWLKASPSENRAAATYTR